MVSITCVQVTTSFACRRYVLSRLALQSNKNLGGHIFLFTPSSAIKVYHNFLRRFVKLPGFTAITRQGSVLVFN